MDNKEALIKELIGKIAIEIEFAESLRKPIKNIVLCYDYFFLLKMHIAFSVYFFENPFTFVFNDEPFCFSGIQFIIDITKPMFYIESIYN